MGKLPSLQSRNIQIAAYIGICEALWTIPTMALNTILHIASVDIAGRCIAAKVAIRFRESGT